ncbi:MAG: PIN/TRAM domain-containing protein [Planctomycetota bacterium]|nr:PIN/TRAM domain-containing protein [Planctomycetota bacterium]
MDEPRPRAQREEPTVPPERPRRSASPSQQARTADLAQRRMLLGVRLLYMVLLATVALLPFVGSITKDQEFRVTDYLGVLIATFAFGAAILMIDAATPNKRLASVFGIYLGIIAGLLAALAISAVLDLIAQSWDLTSAPWTAYVGLVKVGLTVTLCYLAVSIVLTTKDDFRLVIPYVEFAKQVRGVRPLLLDTSALIDGRIDTFGKTGFLDAPLIVPQFVLNELQTLADSSDKLKRARGRRGLELLSKLQTSAYMDVTIDPADIPGHSVDHMLIRLAEDQQLRILTTDYNLNKVAQIHGVTVLNINDLANALRPQVIPGEQLQVDLVKPGEAPGQGVGYLPDGTMVVVENGGDHVGETVALVVTNSLQTSAGRMIFGRLLDGEGDEPDRAVERMAESATHQARATATPSQHRDAPSRRTPRR